MASSTHSDWQVVLRNSAGKVVLYNQLSNEVAALSASELEEGEPTWIEETENDEEVDDGPVASSSALQPTAPTDLRICPLCKQNVPPIRRPELTSLTSRPRGKAVRTHADGRYFRLLSRTSTPQASRPSTPPPASPTLGTSRAASGRPSPGDSTRRPAHPLGDDKRIDGYYSRFFVEERKLGRGQRGSVFLCRHVLDDNYLGYYAVKKIPVGQSSPELMSVLQEVKYLERLHHENLVRYHHAWLENDQVSRFGPTVPTLFILMDFANGGSLDSFVRARQGLASGTSTPRTSGVGVEDEDERRRNRQKKLFRQRKQSSAADGVVPPVISPAKAVHLLSLDEILPIFRDICRGLAFLHSKGILHRDLKGENVLLTWADEDAMIPSAALADFGSSIAMSENWQRQRSGRTGTLDWVPPESLMVDPKTGRHFEVTKKGDIWQLGMILHYLCFFRLPYHESDDIDRLMAEILAFRGFAIPDFTLRDKSSSYHRRDLPLHLLELLSAMLTIDPSARPSCDVVLEAIERIQNEPSSNVPHHALVPAISRTPPLEKPSPLDVAPAVVEQAVGSAAMPLSTTLARVDQSQLLVACLVIFKSFFTASLFGPLSQASFGWLTILNIIEIFAGDLRLSFGLSLLQGGVWLGRTLLP